MTPHDFYQKLAVGQEGEAKIHDWLSQEWQLTHATIQEEIEQGIDFIALHKTTGEKQTFEVKTDKNPSGNVFIETIKNDQTNALGWAYTCTADMLIYYLPNFLSKLLLVRPVVIRENLPFWVKKFRSVPAQNKGYNTIGVLVPVAELEFVAERVTVLDWGCDDA